MGLISEVIMAELGKFPVECDVFVVILCIAGYQTREEAEARLYQSLDSILTRWPRENFSGFMVHFTNRNLEALRYKLRVY